MDKKTSWGEVAEWYNELLSNDNDSYQNKVILPNIIRIVDPKPQMKIADIACGQGFFSFAFAQKGAQVVGCDIGEELIKIANNQKEKIQLSNVEFFVCPANKTPIADNSIDTAVINLALQNIEDLSGTIKEISRILKPNGKFVLTLNHPNFRIPHRSSWQWDDKTNTQYRRIDGYMSETNSKIDMNPGENNSTKKQFTYSFHRPLQNYFKALVKNGFAITRLEEWISHKESQPGPKQAEENRIRKEIPMFMCLEAERNS